MTRAGIHADGLLKDEEIYNIFDTAAILNRPALVAVDAFSGSAGIAHWIKGYFRLSDEEAIGKRSELAIQMKERVDKEYEAGPQHRHERWRAGGHAPGDRARDL